MKLIEAAALAGACLALALPVSAQREQTHLVVIRNAGASDCPDATELARGVRRLKRGPALDPTGTSPARTRLLVEVNRTPEGYAAVIRAQGDRTGERALSDVGPGCGNLADALVLTLALVVESFDERRLDSWDPLARGHGAARAEAEGDRSETIELSPPDLEAGAGAAFFMADDVSALLFAGGELWVGPVVSIGVGGLFVLPDEVDLPPGKVTLSLAAGVLRPCFSLGDRLGLRLGLCLQGMVGALRGEGHDFAGGTSSGTVLYSALGAGVVGGGPIAGPLHWTAHAMAHGVPSDLRFTVENQENRHQVARAGGYVAAGLRVAFE